VIEERFCHDPGSLQLVSVAALGGGLPRNVGAMGGTFTCQNGECLIRQTGKNDSRLDGNEA
jgi:hypothetical protein